jgi:hypothetical protein
MTRPVLALTDRVEPSQKAETWNIGPSRESGGGRRRDDAGQCTGAKALDARQATHVVEAVPAEGEHT